MAPRKSRRRNYQDAEDEFDDERMLPRFEPEVLKGPLRDSVTQQELMDAIPGSCGLLINIEKKLKCTRSAVRNLVENDPAIQQALADEEEHTKDNIVMATIQAAMNGDAKAREFYLKTQARDRGYGDKPVQQKKDDAPLVSINVPQGQTMTRRERNSEETKNDDIASWAGKYKKYDDSQTQRFYGKDINAMLEEMKKGGEAQE